jgi:hypothetical protein
MWKNKPTLLVLALSICLWADVFAISPRIPLKNCVISKLNVQRLRGGGVQQSTAHKPVSHGKKYENSKSLGHHASGKRSGMQQRDSPHALEKALKRILPAICSIGNAGRHCVGLIGSFVGKVVEKLSHPCLERTEAKVGVGLTLLAAKFVREFTKCVIWLEMHITDFTTKS